VSGSQDLDARRGRVIAVDDDHAMTDVLGRQLSMEGFTIEVLTDPAAALRRIGETDFDVLLTDLRMRGMDGMELCRRTLDLRPGLPVIVVTAFGSLETAVEAIRAGAYDFLTKPYDMRAVALALDRAVAHGRLRAELQRLREDRAVSGRIDGLVGQSPAMQAVYDLIGRLADSDVTVLIRGESGTGKELVAHALHDHGRRAGAPFVAINCGALPENLLESELFGHARGAFTDAKSAREGLMMRAHGGTLFLDEIGDMPTGMQVKLLRALEGRKVRPVGSESELPWDGRVIAATHRDLERAVAEGRFREDLFFRLNVVEIELPPLRARGNDVLLIAEHALARDPAKQRIRGLAPEAARLMLAYDWPGNVRELRNCIERAVALARFDQITAEDLPARIRNHANDRPPEEALLPEQFVSLEQLERQYIERVLQSVGHHQASAARILGIDRKTLYRKLQQWSRH
jgi:two-component system, NtrC family, response regulator AtoC